MRRVRAVLFVLGAALFIGVLIRIGPAAAASMFARLSWYLPLIIVFPHAVIVILEALGWRFAFRRNRVAFRALISAGLAGEAFNVTTPTASLGGEAVKAWLIRPYVPLTESLPAVIIAKTTVTIGQALYLLLGLVVGMTILPLESPLLQAMQWFLVLEVFGIGGFIAIQTLGVLGTGGRILRQLGLLATADGAHALGRVDRALVHFYRKEPWRLALSIGCHFLGWAVGALEVYLIMWALGVHVSLATAVVIDTIASGISFAMFLVPARLGVLEAGEVAIFLALGLGAPVGLTVALTQRLREAAWTGIGFLAVMSLRATGPEPAGAPLEAEH